MSDLPSYLLAPSDSLPDQPADVRRWTGLYGSAFALAIHEAALARSGPILVIAKSSQQAHFLLQEILFFSGADYPVDIFPDYETLIYDGFSPHQDIVSDRLKLLSRDFTGRSIIIAPISTLLMRLPPRAFLIGHNLRISVGDRLNLTDLRRQLEAAAYRVVDTVVERGEFTVRGAVLDLYPMGAHTPFRIELFDDDVDSIRTFDPDTQLSTGAISAIDTLPAREVPLTKEGINRFQDHWHLTFGGNPRSCPIYQDVSSGLAPAGIEYYLPLFFDKTETLFDYLPDQLLIMSDPLSDPIERFWENARNRYESLRYNLERPILPPEQLLLREDDFRATLKNYPRIDHLEEAGARAFDFMSIAVPDVSIDDQAKDPFHRLRARLDTADQRILICAESPGRRELIDQLLRQAGWSPTLVDSWQSFLSSDATLTLAIAPTARSLNLPDKSLIVLSEAQLFGERVLQARRRQKERDQADELVVRSLTELSEGAPVVHQEHGVGRYQGLVTLAIDDQSNEFLSLLYQDEATLYVPVADLHLISRYTGADADLAPWHRLGSDVWEKAKRKAAEQIRDVAAELLEIYARREAKQGLALPPPDADYERFARGFPFEETADQLSAIEAVISDLCSPKPTDRLICGDVGFGKTEVAMRAAFLAVQAGKQVAILVPTTLLAEQHLQSFQDRFADWPVKIESISRFKSRKEQDAVIETLANGRTDIVIGTHALIQDQVRFHDLGLLIIDEEHRFGVRQKERIKSLRANVDVLAMTATPIPRTLNLSMTGLRDLSIIATPPARRLSIKTFIRPKDLAVVKEAIQRELLRGGQVYYLHNEVKDIEQCADELKQLVPEARVLVGHGQMREKELEQVMSDFYHQRANILVCTTIIETGIDIPNANTIIMDRADKFGLAQIHQLRGRVGRSHHQAYAYLLIPEKSRMTRDAEQRLEAIAGAEDLGAGFILATHDMEIRGAGELLGESQTGNMTAIGFGLYMDMLDRAVKAFKDGKQINLEAPIEDSTEIKLHLPALIPEPYLPDVHMRLVLYKRIANAADTQALRALQVEMIDRFGLLPDPLKNLFRVTELKLQAERLGITKIDFGPRGGKIDFAQDTQVSPDRIITLVQTQSQRYRFASANQLAIVDNIADREQRFKHIEDLLQHFQAA
ncbi:MAG: transcription-repair coupling factor [Proteobacteria bacterium]|nr:transcription-repair coupling factor [Pseudomonadota bacterium]